MKNGLFILLTTIVLTSCLSYGENTRLRYAPLKEVPCEEKPTSLHLFFEGEAIDFQYEKIGLIEIQGAEYDTNEDLIGHLKHQAWKHCANGVIKIEQQYKNRDEGIAFAPETESTYSSKVFLGIAVRITKDEAFLERFGEGIEVTEADKELKRT